MFQRRSLETAQTLLNPAKAKDLDGHQLVQNGNAEISSAMILHLGEELLGQVKRFETGLIFPHTALPSQAMLKNLYQRGNDRFLVKLMTKPAAADHFLATGKVVKKHDGTLTIELQILPVSMAMLEKGKDERHTDTTRLLAAAALSASALPESMSQGLETTQCSTKVSVVGSVTPDHSAPLATVFEQFSGSNATLSTLQPVTGIAHPTLADMTHLHGVAPRVANKARLHATRSGIAGGMELITRRLDELHGVYLLNFIHREIPGIGNEIVTLSEMFPHILKPGILAQTSAALGFTAHVIGDTTRERAVERTFDKRNADTPLQDLLLGLR